MDYTKLLEGKKLYEKIEEIRFAIRRLEDDYENKFISYRSTSKSTFIDKVVSEELLKVFQAQLEKLEKEFKNL